MLNDRFDLIDAPCHLNIAARPFNLSHHVPLDRRRIVIISLKLKGEETPMAAADDVRDADFLEDPAVDLECPDFRLALKVAQDRLCEV